METAKMEKEVRGMGVDTGRKGKKKRKSGKETL